MSESAAPFYNLWYLCSLYTLQSCVPWVVPLMKPVLQLCSNFSGTVNKAWCKIKRPNNCSLLYICHVTVPCESEQLTESRMFTLQDKSVQSWYTYIFYGCLNSSSDRKFFVVVIVFPTSKPRSLSHEVLNRMCAWCFPNRLQHELSGCISSIFDINVI